MIFLTFIKLSSILFFQIHESTKVLKSSKTFFSELEDQMKKHVNFKNLQKTSKATQKFVTNQVKI